MNIIWALVLSAICLFGPAMPSGFPPKTGKCPFKDGIIRKLTAHSGILVGSSPESTVDVWGKDSLVLSATNGKVINVIGMRPGASYIQIQIDTTVYTYSDIDRALVQEGQFVRSGQPIAIAADSSIAFYVGNYLGKIYHHPEAYVDCVCQLPNQPSQ
jgi:hypothetical protein